MSGRAALAALALAVLARPLTGQETPPVGRDAALALEFPPLEFQAPEPELHVLPGEVDVLYLEDRTLPLVTVMARFPGGYGRFPREYYAAAMALSTLLRTGGTRALPPDSLDALLEFHALQTSFGTDGGTITSSVNALTRELETALQLWGEMLRAPRFDSLQVEVWRGQTWEGALRRKDDPARLAFSQFNRLMYGDHPIGWELGPEDLTPELLSRERLAWLHRRIVCPDRLTLGVTGDVSWEQIEPLLVRLLEGWPACEGAIPAAPLPTVRESPGVFLIPRDLEQSTVVLAHASDVRLGDSPEFFAAEIGNAILGASGFSSRLLLRLRTEEGYAYSAASLWTTPRRYKGLVGALTSTKTANTVAAIRLILETMEEMTLESPSQSEVQSRVDETVNGFVFNFESPAVIVLRHMAYRANDFPTDWLQRYLEGIQEVEPDDVLEIFQEKVHPEEMTILVVGDPDGFDEPLETLGPVTVLDVDERTGTSSGLPVISSPSGAQRSPR